MERSDTTWLDLYKSMNAHQIGLAESFSHNEQAQDAEAQQALWDDDNSEESFDEEVYEKDIEVCCASYFAPFSNIILACIYTTNEHTCILFSQ